MEIGFLYIDDDGFIKWEYTGLVLDISFKILIIELENEHT